MTGLTKKQVKHVAKLAKLNLTKVEIDKFSGQLSKVVDYFRQLQEVDISKIEPTSQTTGLENVIREDEMREESLTQDEALSGSEKVDKGFFVVPMILEERTDK